ncbi:MAG: helix-turn-helix transcriptional regulator [Pseudomonadota bacterium]
MNMSFEVDSQKIKQARQKRLWSQDELAEAAGLSERTVQ